MVNKKNAVFFVFGFALAVYLKVPVTGVAIFGACLALILTGYATLKMTMDQRTIIQSQHLRMMEVLTMKMKNSDVLTKKT